MGWQNAPSPDEVIDIGKKKFFGWVYTKNSGRLMFQRTHHVVSVAAADIRDQFAPEIW